MVTVLMIDDEPELVKVLSSYLQKVGYKVSSTPRGDSGLTACETQKPDLVILDLNLPGMDD